MDSICLVIPMKCPQFAKQRLATCLPNAERETLAISLFRNTLAFFQTYFPRLQVMVISASSDMLALASAYSAETLLEEGNNGLNGALSQACQWVERAGFSHQLIIPSDIALLDQNEISTLLHTARCYQVVVANAKDGGTNALMTSPPNAIPFHYGENSAAKHSEDAQRLGLSYCQLDLVNLSQDIDQSDDLARAIAQQPERFLARCSLSVNPFSKERVYA